MATFAANVAFLALKKDYLELCAEVWLVLNLVKPHAKNFEILLELKKVVAETL